MARGRGCEVEEIIGGVPYGRVWFYWRYDDGWRHVPPDYTFWGDARTVEADGVLGALRRRWTSRLRRQWRALIWQIGCGSAARRSPATICRT